MDSQVGTSNVQTGKQAVDSAAAQKKSNTVGKQTTSRGTLITKQNNEFDEKSFLKIMTAQMKNMDPSSSQDNTQYVTQMAQFATMQQMNALNSTMRTSSYQGLIGKGVTVDVSDVNGDPYTGIVRGVTKENNEWYLSVEVEEKGKKIYKVFDASTLKSVLGTSDYTNQNMLLNSDFMAASNLASDSANKVVILDTDATGTQSIVKGTVKKAFLDNGVVKIRVAAFDANGNESTTTTEYSYSSVVKAGNLTDADMNVTVQDYVTNNSSDTDTTTPGNLSNSKTVPKGSSYNDVTNLDIQKQQQKAQAVQNG